jgi:hypothetical protein
LSEVLARTRHDSVLSAVNYRAQRHLTQVGLTSLRRFRSALPSSATGYARISMAIAMTAIVVNALILQRERHPAPFFVEKKPISPVSTKPAGEHTAPTTVPDSATIARASPTVRPSESINRLDPSSASRPMDPIADMIHSEANKDLQRLMATAQSDLSKLGYSIRAGASSGSDTIAALHDFEKAHGLPISNEVTARLVKLLTAAVNSSVAR